MNANELGELDMNGEKILQSVHRARLLETAMRLLKIPSRTGEAGPVSDELESC